MFNFSEWSATISSKAISNLYHPGNPRGFGPTASRVGWSVGTDMAWDVVREFWPEIAHKFKLPFRTRDAEVVGRSRVPQAPVAVAAGERPVGRLQRIAAVAVARRRSYAVGHRVAVIVDVKAHKHRKRPR